MIDVNLVGNCQTHSVAEILPYLLGDCRVNRVETEDVCGALKAQKNTDNAINIVISNQRNIQAASNIFNIVDVPAVVLPDSLPDCVHVGVKGPIGGNLHSFITSTCYLLKISKENCYQLFNERVYKNLGYNSACKGSICSLENIVTPLFEQDAKKVIEKWRSINSKVMHTINHPKLFIVQDLLKAAFRKRSIEFRNVDACEFALDPLGKNLVFPSLSDDFFESGHHPTDIFFKEGQGLGGRVLSLYEFIERSFQFYEKNKYQNNDLLHHRHKNGGLDRIEVVFKAELTRQEREAKTRHPYKGRPDYGFWKKVVSNLPMAAVDPAVSSDLHITPSQKIATAGSCFAQHIAKRLNKEGFNYYVAEQPPVDMSPQEQSALGYGVFSGRYGNLYTTRQLLQLFDRAFGEYSPSIEPWQRADGRYVDPFRPQICPEGYATPVEVVEAQSPHLIAVKRMFQELDVFVFTLGLTECWEHITDGAILPLAPGVAGGTLDWEHYRFRNFSKDEVKSDLDRFLSKLKIVNPNARVLLTVSPVPLMATYEDRHVLVSTTVSKSVLRVVADEVTAENDQVFYFPSYEIITGNFNRGAYYQDDLREVRSEGVDHVMRLFIQHCTGTADSANEGPLFNQSSDSSSNLPKDESVGLISSAEADELNEVLCDEDALDV
ncbi:GSCFA domain-containing protein [Marinobacter metalliresistant]|uniref:GSCFA domain-containing protein n=1 Tax=Marinobacter metalliresistant TaxID=2961995 RepID=A0ABZ2W5T7_9GAMM